MAVNPLPFFYVGSSVTNERLTNFLAHKHPALSDLLGKPDTKSIWYSKEHFEKLLEEIQYSGGDGIRLQFGMYETGHEFEGQMCLMMNVTREEIVGEVVFHKNVILEDEPDFSERSALPRNIIAFPDNDPLSLLSKDFNYGSPCPPRCDVFEVE